MEESMKKELNSMQMTYTSQTYKTFGGALEAFFCQECPQIGGMKTRQVLVKVIIDMVSQFYPETSYLRPGQTVWPTVDVGEKMSYGKTIKETKLTTVILDLVKSTDALERSKGKKLKDIKKEAIARLCKQAYTQKGCLTSAEISILLKMSIATVGKYIREWESENREALPRRGTIHDLGPTLTHKKMIIEKLFLEQKSVGVVSRETCHSYQAIQRYISTFRQVMLCHQKGMKTDEIAYLIGRTKRLVKEYEELIDEFKEKNYILEQFMKMDIEVDPNWKIDLDRQIEGQTPLQDM